MNKMEVKKHMRRSKLKFMSMLLSFILALSLPFTVYASGQGNSDSDIGDRDGNNNYENGGQDGNKRYSL